mgnify:CR=1 FL=1
MTDETRVTYGGRLQSCEVLYERGDSVRVRLASGKPITVKRDRVVYPKVTVIERAAMITGMEPPAWREPSPAPALVAVPKPPKPWRSEAYRAHVRTLSCCVTGYRTDEAHHHGPHAMGRKGPDWFCIPLTAAIHERFHRTGTFPGMTREETDALALVAQIECMSAWLEKRGVDSRTVVRDALAVAVEADSTKGGER